MVFFPIAGLFDDDETGAVFDLDRLAIGLPQVPQNRMVGETAAPHDEHEIALSES